MPSNENTCTGTWGQNYVRRSAVIALSGSYAYITPITVNMASSCSRSFNLLTDINGNPIPADTTATADNISAYYTCSTTGNTFLASTSITAGSPVMSTNNYGGTPTTLTVNACGICIYGIDSYPAENVNVVVTTPKNHVTTIPVTVN